MKKFNENQNFRKALLSGISVVALTAMVSAGPAIAADESANIEGGAGATIDGADTFTIDNTNDGEGDAAAISFSGSGAVSLTIDSDGLDAQGTVDTGEIGAVTVTDGGAGATNDLIINDATNGDALTVLITGDIDGDVATDANDLNITINAASTDDAGGTTVDIDGDVDLGTGSITLTGDANDDATLLVSGAADQTVTGTIVSTTDDTGSFIIINNGTNTATFESAIGSAGVSGIEALTVGNGTAGGQATFEAAVDAAAITVAGTTAASSANFDGAVTGATIAVTGHANGAASANFAGDVTAATTLTKATNDATMTIDGTGAQAITGAIAAGNDGDGVLAVTNTGGTVTFVGKIGDDAGNAIGSMTLASGSTIDISSDVDVGTLTGGGAINVSGSAEIETATDLGASGTAFTVSVDAGQTLTTDAGADGTIYADVALDGAGSTLVLGANNETNLTGDITATTDGEGVVTVTGNNAVTVITGNIGTSSKDIDTLNGGAQGVQVVGNTYAETITGAAGAMNFDGNVAAATVITAGAGDVAVSGNLTAGSIVADTGKDFTFDGTSAQTVTGAITTGTAGGGALSVTNTGGTVTFASAVGVNAGNEVGAVTLADDSTTVFQSTLDAADLVLGTGTVTFNAAVNLDATGAGTGTLTTVDGSTITLGSAFTDGTIAITGDDSSATLDQTADAVTVNMSSAFTTGTVTLYSDSGANGALDATDLAAFSVTDTALVDYTLVLTDADTIDITASAKSAATTARELGVSTQNAIALARANTALASGDATALTALTTALNAGGTEATKAAEQVGVQADTLGAATVVVVGAGSQALGTATTRLASLRSGAQYAAAETGQTGFSAGSSYAAEDSFWLKPFSNWVNQDDRSGVDGFDASTYGLAIGADTMVSDDVRVGVSAAYSNTNVDGDGAGNSEVDIDSYQVGVYGDYTTANYYVEGAVAYAYNDSETSRTLNFGGLDRIAKGDYAADQYMVSVGAGMPINLQGNTFVTPMAGLAYTHVSPDSYTETGAGNLNVAANPEDVDAFVASAGAKLHTQVKHEGGYLVPSAQAGVSYDFAGDEASVTGTYTGGGSAFTVEGADVAQFAGNVGLGLAYDSGDWSVGADYDAEIKSDYVGHSATLEARFKF
ncbi:MAG: autotransporter domain-containing protein [Rhodospirillales bacterium]|nr:autotransporter domain-containing protein [Rhodospirillales bacterium]